MSRRRGEEVRALFDERNYDPISVLIDEHEDAADAQTRIQIATTLLPYYAPRLKQLDVDAHVAPTQLFINTGISGEVGEDLEAP